MAKITVHVQTQKKQSLIEALSISPPIFKVKTCKPPKDGLANQDILLQLSYYFHCPKTDLCIIKGHTHKEKLINIPYDEEKLNAFLKEKEGYLL